MGGLEVGMVVVVGVDGWMGAGLLASAYFLSIESSEAEKVRSPPSPVPHPPVTSIGAGAGNK